MAYSFITRPKTSLKRRSLHEEVADYVRTMIIEGELAEGQRINETELCKYLEISRTPLREALKVLHTEGLVIIEPNRGAWVTTITIEEMRELFEIICSLERQAAELAAQRASDAELEQMEKMQERMEKHFREGDQHTYFELNQALHHAVIELAGNSALAVLHGQLMARVSRGRYLAINVDKRWEESVQEHRLLLDALKQHDSERAGAILMEHVKHTGSIVIEALEQRDREEADAIQEA